MKPRPLHRKIHDSQILALVAEGIHDIAQNQETDGGFLTFSSPDARNFDVHETYRTTFAAANILSCLNTVSDSLELPGIARAEIDAIRKKAADFLLAQKSDAWTWNYWSKTSPERETLPYPDDLDDTFAALYALEKYDQKIVTPDAMASIVKTLAALEIEEGGPYRTWIVNGRAAPKWQDIDIAVNSTIGTFFADFHIEIPQITCLVKNAISEKKLGSPYYPGLCHATYFLARYYGDTGGKTLIESIKSHATQSGSAFTTLEQALTLSSLINLGEDPREMIHDVEDLISTIETEKFGPHPFCLDPKRDGLTHYAGSRALTAAFCIEALARWQARQKTIMAFQPWTRQNSPVHDRVRNLAKEQCLGTQSELGTMACRVIDATTDESITLLAYDFSYILAKHHRTVPQEIVEQLALGNLYGWMAYTIYDDFLDGEGNPLLMSAANLFLRELTTIYAGLRKPYPAAWDLFQSILRDMDNANAWEQINCQIPPEKCCNIPEKIPDFGDFSILAKRSMGHALGALTQLIIVGYSIESAEFQHVASFFRHYLTARQLHDDAHDWAEDLMMDRITSVSSIVLKDFKNRLAPVVLSRMPTEIAHPSDSLFAGETLEGNIPLPLMIPLLEETFWQHSVDAVAKAVKCHLKAAREARENSEMLCGLFFMEKDLHRFEETANIVLKERDETIKFLEAYRSKP